MVNEDDRITYIGRTDHRNSNVRFGIRQNDRRSHIYVCGKTGVGKSHLLKTMILQDIAAGCGCAVIDPHGDLARDIYQQVPPSRRADLDYLDATAGAGEWRLNPFESIEPSAHALACAGIVDTLKKIWPDDWGPRLEHLIRNIAFTLLETSDSSFADIPQLLADRTYRSTIVNSLRNDVVRDFWKNEFDRYSQGFRSVVVAPLQNKVGALLTDPTLRRILASPGRQIRVGKAMDTSKILVVNLDKGIIGEGPSAMLGSFMVSQIAHAALTRSMQRPEHRRDFALYLDEFQTFTTLSVATMLSELRKYAVGLVLSHQHLSQLTPEIRDAVFGNVGTMIAFRTGARDAELLSREFAPTFSANDIINLPRYAVYVRLLIDGQTSKPFSATTLGDAD